MKISYFDCFSGISGDMILGALIDAGLDIDLWKKELLKLPIPESEYRIEITKANKIFMEGTKVNIIELDNNSIHQGKNKDHKKHRHLNDILEIIEISKLNNNVKLLSNKIFKRIAEVESKIHNIDINKVHFHELSGLDTIIDIVGSLIAFNLLGIEKIYSSPIPIGSGIIDAAHGKIPVPAPATIELLKNCPIYSNNIADEVTTPTGAAIITTLSEHIGYMPQMKVLNIGYGAGSKDFKIPNLLRVIIGELTENIPTKEQLLIETTIDDMNPQIYEYLMQKLFDAGALDVYYTPIFMKKQRPATLITILTDICNEGVIAETIFKETTTIGYRKRFVDKVELNRDIYTIETPWGSVRVKKATFGDNINISPEYEDCKKIANKFNMPLKRVLKEIEKIISA
ncbi:MAG: nickel pincer cofactor biosynthesis protein LarC [Deferribacterota bacterium]|nr:nickel pincer cofactor biosynthesis protein LarC [Deferribacterota bacterium]